MLLDNITNIVTDQLFKIGKEELNKKFPRDFEAYMCALELVDDKGFPVDYFVFPIMPNSISKPETEATSIQTSFLGITVFNKQGFIPKEINIQGDFGRAFKFISFEQENYYRSLFFSIKEGYYTADSVNSGVSGTLQKIAEFPFGIKSGYGCIKILQSIIDKAKAHGVSGNTFKLYFHNPALGESYLVVPTKQPLTLSQNVQSSNMIWQYNLSLVIIANMKDVLDYNSAFKKNMSYSFGVDKVLKGVAGIGAISKLYSSLTMKIKL